MARSTIHVTYGDGSSAKGVKVDVSINGAFCKPAFVDGSGCATVEHSSSGSAKVYIHGSLRGEFRAPGSTRVRAS
ncbi:MAG: hypothetical protein KDA83_08975 [Planctomycetales bacterium]|nr:hypothetical protein [Planctomycetales bacterium]